MELLYKRQLKEDILDAMPDYLKYGEGELKKLIDEISEEEVSKLFTKRTALHTNKLLTTYLSAAYGQQYCYKVVHTKNDKGKIIKKHVLVEDPAEIQAFLDNPLMIHGQDYCYITTTRPDTNAIESLMNRIMGKAATVVTGGKNSDGSDSPVKVVVANFGSVNSESEAVDSGHIAGNIVQEIVNQEENEHTPVSYTHLTLPTIYSV